MEVIETKKLFKEGSREGVPIRSEDVLFYETSLI